MTDPTLPADAPTSQEAHTTMAVAVSFAALSTAAGLLNVISSARVEMTGGLILLVGGNLAALGTYLLLRRGFPQAAGLVIVTACGAITTALMIVGYGLHDVSVVGFPLVVLISGLVLRRLAHVLSLLVCAGGLALVAYLETKGVIDTPFNAPSLTADLLSILIVLIAVSIFVRMLARGFRQALGRAHASESALALTNRELKARTLRLEAQELERVTLISDLEAKNAELERFTYTVSHDLKSPLITVRAYLDSIGKDLDEGRLDRVRADVHRVSDASDKMRALLDGLLKLSRVGRIVNTLEERSLRALAQEAVDLTSGRLAARRLLVVVTPNLPTVRVDRQRILDVFVNLLDNAAKFMGDQASPRVEIDAVESPGRVVVRVKDNGMGIEPKHHQRIFGLFERLDTAYEGTGLGLALSRRVVEAHGGRLWVESDGIGRGSTFCFSLPQI